MLKLTQSLSDISRTNQLEIMEKPENVAEKLFQYLFKLGKGIETFPVDNLDLSMYEDPSLNEYQKRHRAIKQEIKKRLAIYNENWKSSDIQYFVSYSKNYVFFLSPNKTHSGWKQLFCKQRTDRERILNSVFKFHILAQDLPAETINGFEKLLLVYSKSLDKDNNDILYVWGQELYINYNPYDVLTLTLTRKNLRFLSTKNHYGILDSDDLGEFLLHKRKNYGFSNELDGRRKNFINFISFNPDYDKFKKTQLYYHQSLIAKLGDFLDECGIAYQAIDFQADHFLENPFIKNVETVETLEIINNSGVDLTGFEKQFLQKFLQHQGVSYITFYNSGKTISTYEQVKVEGEETPCWKITEIIPWSDIELDKGKNYLVFNKLLDEEAGSKAYQRDDGLWKPSTKTNGKSKVDFYSQLKGRFSYLETGEFYSTQGINLAEFRAIKDADDKELNSSSSVFIYNYARKKIDKDTLRLDTQTFTDGKFLDIEDSVACYLIGQNDSENWEKFCQKHNIKISPEFQKILIELGIKNWIRKSLVDSNFGLPVPPQSFSEKQFFAIYVRKPKKQKAKAVAVEFVYKEGFICIKSVMRDVQQIQKRFPFLRTLQNNPDVLKDDQQYFADEATRSFISCYTNDFYTPTLIGRKGILEEMESGELKINRQVSGEHSSRLLPLVMYYNGEVKPVKRIHNMICFDLSNETFVQYYVPPGTGLGQTSKTGFRVYHLIGNTYSNPKRQIPTFELINHPITALHFGTLTQNILKISDNSQSSLLQKVAKVLVEN